MLKLFPTCVFALALAAQAQTFGVPRIGAIEYYGIHKLSEQRIAKPLGLQPGDPLPPSKGDIEDRLEKIPGVVQARFTGAWWTVILTVVYVAVMFGVVRPLARRFAARYEGRETPGQQLLAGVCIVLPAG